MVQAFNDNMGAVFDAVIAAGGWSWQLWNSWQTPSAPQCAAQLRTLCSQGNASAIYRSALLQEWTNTSEAGAAAVPAPCHRLMVVFPLCSPGPLGAAAAGRGLCNLPARARALRVARLRVGGLPGLLPTACGPGA